MPLLLAPPRGRAYVTLGGQRDIVNVGAAFVLDGPVISAVSADGGGTNALRRVPAHLRVARSRWPSTSWRRRVSTARCGCRPFSAWPTPPASRLESAWPPGS